MTRTNRILANATFAIVVLLSFLLVFESRIAVPVWLQAFGRVHPLLLHLPIGLLLLTAVLVFLKKYFNGTSFNLLVTFLLHITALTASVSALMGLFLSREGGYNELELSLHKWFGVATCYVAAVLLIIKIDSKLFKPMVALAVVVLIVAGHFGAVLTHGDSFVFGPFQQAEGNALSAEDASAFEAVVQPIFERKCTSCHNETKAKGKLILTSYEHIIKGGKSGALWSNDGTHTSLLVRRVSLPLEEKKHMPPKDKPQLTPDELDFLSRWIERGADTGKKLSQYDESDSLRIIGSRLVASAQSSKAQLTHYTFDFVTPEKIESLNNPYRSVFQIAQNEPALQADFFVRQAFERNSLTELTGVNEQLVSVNLAKMPVTDAELKTLAGFKNLETLNLNQTDITGATLSDLQPLEKLASLSLSGTKVTAAAMDALRSMKNLKKVFIWNTSISAAEADELRKKYPDILWESGYVPDAREILQLSNPLMISESVLKNNEPVKLKASLPGTTIRYTLDGTTPDSVTGFVYDKPIPAQAYKVVKAIAYKDGWKHSNVTEFVVFKDGLKPTHAELKTAPEPRYPGDGVVTFTDGKKGAPDFFREPTWIAFREGKLEAIFYFDSKPTIQSITLSFSKNAGAMTMPPETMEVWGGDDEAHLTLIKKVTPAQPTDYNNSRIEGVELTFPPATWKCYKIIAKPLAKLPAFRQSKDKGWLMVDEIFFN